MRIDMSIYKATNIDTDKFLEMLEIKQKLEEERHRFAVAIEEARHKEAMERLRDVEDMFYCSNYEKGE